MNCSSYHGRANAATAKVWQLSLGTLHNFLLRSGYASRKAVLRHKPEQLKHIFCAGWHNAGTGGSTERAAHCHQELRPLPLPACPFCHMNRMTAAAMTCLT